MGNWTGSGSGSMGELMQSLSTSTGKPMVSRVCWETRNMGTLTPGGEMKISSGVWGDIVVVVGAMPWRCGLTGETMSLCCGVVLRRPSDSRPAVEVLSA